MMVGREMCWQFEAPKLPDSLVARRQTPASSSLWGVGTGAHSGVAVTHGGQKGHALVRRFFRDRRNQGFFAV